LELVVPQRYAVGPTGCKRLAVPTVVGRKVCCALMATSKKPPKGGRLVFCRWFIHPKTKKRVYPRNRKAFCFWVDE